MFGAQWVTGDARRFGACGALVSQMDDLNGRTWRATPADLAEWRHAGADFGAPLEVAARFAFALMRDLAGKATDNRLPMLLDHWQFNQEVGQPIRHRRSGVSPLARSRADARCAGTIGII